MRGAHDDATPNANAVMISNLVALNLLTGKPAYLDRAARHPRGLRRRPRPRTRSATAACSPAPSTCIAPQHVVVIEPADAGRAPRRLARARCSTCRSPAPCSRSSPAAQLPSSPGPLAGKTAVGGKPTAYACIGPQCNVIPAYELVKESWFKR